MVAPGQLDLPGFRRILLRRPWPERLINEGGGGGGGFINAKSTLGEFRKMGHFYWAGGRGFPITRSRFLGYMLWEIFVREVKATELRRLN